MSFRKLIIIPAAVACALATAPGFAKVTQAEADKLKGELMPLGGEKAANADGSIPAWDGGLKKAHTQGERYLDPFESDQPILTINKANMGEHKAMLSEGQMAMLEKYDDYKINVYKTRRTTSVPEFVSKATYQNALTANLQNDGEALKDASIGPAFPIPKNGHEIIWNHKTRFRGESGTRWNNQAAVTNSGDYSLFKLQEDVKFQYNVKGMTPENMGGVLVYFLQRTMAPPRQAGGILLVHDTLDQIADPRRAWLYNPGQRRLRRAPNVAYDNPGTGADGLRVNDQLDVFNGATDRYTFKLVGKKEMYVPANAYKIHSDTYKYDDVIKPNHVNMDLARYERRRVWVVDSNLKEGTSHIYKRRVFYVDEDSWQIALVDIYDKRDQLWRFQEGHTVVAYDIQATLPVLGTVYDLQSGRYLTMDMNNEDPEFIVQDFDDSYFQTSNVKKLATK